jgi:hypothetical protein
MTYPLSLAARISASCGLVALNISLTHSIATHAGIYVCHIPSLSYSANAGGFSSHRKLCLVDPDIFWIISDRSSQITHHSLGNIEELVGMIASGFWYCLSFVLVFCTYV